MPKYTNRKYKQLQIVNERFVQLCDKLIEQESVKNKMALAKRLSTFPNIISDIYNGNRNVSLDLILAITAKFNANPAFLLPPWSDEMFLEDNMKFELHRKKQQLIQIKREVEMAEKMLK